MRFEFNDEYTELMKARHLVETKYEWEKWTYEIPYLQFKPEWQVRVIPPRTGAIIRFIVKQGDKHVSVYLDCYGELAPCDKPYWEIYPDYRNDNARFYIDETDELLEAIEKSLNERIEEEY